MWPNPQETADLVIFTEEILNGKLHFLCSELFQEADIGECGLFALVFIENVLLFFENSITAKFDLVYMRCRILNAV